VPVARSFPLASWPASNAAFADAPGPFARVLIWSTHAPPSSTSRARFSVQPVTLASARRPGETPACAAASTWPGTQLGTQ